MGDRPSERCVRDLVGIDVVLSVLRGRLDVPLTPPAPAGPGALQLRLTVALGRPRSGR